MQKPYIIILIFSLILFYTSFGQYDHLLHKPYSQKSTYIWELNELIISKDSTETFRIINSLEQFADKHKDKELKLEAELMYCYYLGMKTQRGKEEVIGLYQSVIEKARKKNVLQIEARALNHFAKYYWVRVENYELAFENYLVLDRLLEKTNSIEYPDKPANLYQIGEAYYFFSAYKEANIYFKKVIANPPVADIAKWALYASLNTMGLSYQALGELDSSDYYLEQILQSKPEGRYKIYTTIAKGNLGYNNYLRGEYEKAIPLLKEDIEAALNIEDFALASGSLMPLADIYLKQNKIEKADSIVQLARECVYKSGEFKRLRFLYPLLNKIFSAMSKPDLASMYMDSTIFVKDSLSRQFNSLQLLRVHQRADLQKHRSEMASIETEKKIKITILISIIVLLMLVSIFIYWQQYKTGQELILATRQLEDFTKYIREKNSLIETLQQKIDTGEEESLLKLQQITILTDDEWEYFKQLFEKVHSGYLKRLKEKLPLLTPAEIRFMALSKLKLSNKEMAGMLGIGTDAIRQYRSRLRKKLNITEEESLESLVESI